MQKFKAGDIAASDATYQKYVFVEVDGKLHYTCHCHLAQNPIDDGVHFWPADECTRNWTKVGACSTADIEKLVAKFKEIAALRG